METSSASDLRDLYESSVESYAQMMDTEIELPIYGDILSRLKERIAGIDGDLLDTSCGTGHMLHLFRQQYDSARGLVGIDLSPAMVENARARLGSQADLQVGNMKDLSGFTPMSSAAMLSFFAVHHLSPEEIPATFQEWFRTLKPGGQIVVAAWEGSGLIDYGGSSEVRALRYQESELSAWLQGAGFSVDRCWLEEVEEFPMKALYLEGSK